MDSTYPRDCPVCGSNAKTRLYKQAFADVGKVSFLKGYDVVACDGCGFAFADDIPSQAAFDAYYARQSKYETRSSEITALRLDVLKNGLAFLAKGVKDKNSRILEIGCGCGDFLRFLQDDGFTRLSAIEPSQHCVDHLRHTLGISASCGTVSQLNADADFDAIVLLTVLEHVVDLNAAITNVSKMLSRNGLLFIRMPNACRFPDYDDSAFQQFSPEHINYFSIVSAKNLLGKHGYTLLVFEEVALRESDNAVLPMANLLFVKDPGAGGCVSEKDASTRTQLERYITLSRARDSDINGRLSRFVKSQEPIIVWGTGTHTLRLLELGSLRQCNIAMFIDSNPHYEGGLFNNVSIKTPNALLQHSHKVLVSSKVFQKEIAHYIRDELKAPNELILLY